MAFWVTHANILPSIKTYNVDLIEMMNISWLLSDFNLILFIIQIYWLDNYFVTFSLPRVASEVQHMWHLIGIILYTFIFVM